MSNDPDVIRRQIEETRANLSGGVNALGEKVSPTEIAKRQKEKVRGVATSVKDKIMGVAEDAKSSAQGLISDAQQKVSEAGDTASDLPHQVTQGVAQKAQGSPLATGLIAFGAGLLVSAMFPASRPEAQAAAAIKEQAAPMLEQAKSVASDVAENLKQPAQDAVESVKATATDAAQVVKDEAAYSAQDVKLQGHEAVDQVKHQTS